MTPPAQIERSQHAPVGKDGQHGGAYHPGCGEGHHHKPTKAMIGIGLLVVLSFLFHELNGKPPKAHSSSVTSTAHQQSLVAGR